MSVPQHDHGFSLEGWYHTIDLGDGLVTHGEWDHRNVVDRYGFPESLAGKTALDVGTADGFFAFELERRGADRVVAIDIDKHADADWLPGRAPPGAADRPMKERFEIAHARLSSSVEHRTCSVYDLSPETVGEFDVVFCGSLLLHLMNPLLALTNIRSVTRELAVIETLAEPGLDAFPDVPLVRFGHSDSESEPGAACIYWRFGQRALEEMMRYAGFARCEGLEPFRLPPPDMETLVVRGFVDGPAPPKERRRRLAGTRDLLGPSLHKTPVIGPRLATRRRRRLGR